MLDNCTLLENADQRDTDGDGFGNICDGDFNNDGVVNIPDLGIPEFKTRLRPSAPGDARRDAVVD